MRMLLVGSAQDLALVGPGGAHEPFVVHAGDHVLKRSIAIFSPHLGIKRLKARRQKDRPDLDLGLFRGLAEINGLVLADPFADAALFLLQVNTGLVNIRDQGNGLSEIDMDGLVLGYFLIKSIRVFYRAVFDAGCTARAFALYNISGLFRQCDLKVSRLPEDTINLSIRQNLYVGMPADLDQFGREDSDGAVIGRKGLVKLGHMAANGRGLVDQVNLKSSRGKIKRGLNTADPSADNHHIPEVAARQTLANTVCESLSDLVFNLVNFLFQCPSPQ